MAADEPTIRNQNWKTIFTASEKIPTERLHGYIQSRKHLPNFPAIVISSPISSPEEIINVMRVHQCSNDNLPLIFVLCTNGKEHLDYWRLMDLGVDDIVSCTNVEEIINYAESRYERGDTINGILQSPLVTENLAGNSRVWRKFLYEIIETTLYSQASILLIGESGTGKELVSRLIHTIDKRPDKKKMIIIDCTTIVPELSGSELFGHERGSYTSAVQSREGAFALANGGTLFLDEVGELPLLLQAELLRVLQEGMYKKVGSNTWQKTSFRLVCATNKDLRKAVTEGKFRQDLYYRIADCEFSVPSLSERKEDIPTLVSHFLLKSFPPGKCPQVDKPVMDFLMKRMYHGNVRELRQLVQRMLIKHLHQNKITIGEIPSEDRRPEHNGIPGLEENIEDQIRNALLQGEDWWHLKDRISETAIRVALELENNNKEKAAERLGVNVRTVQQYVRKKTN